MYSQRPTDTEKATQDDWKDPPEPHPEQSRDGPARETHEWS